MFRQREDDVMALNTKKSLRNTLFVGYTSILVMVGGFGAWAQLSNINGAVIANATIVAESYSKRVQHQIGGTVLKILIKDGDRVTAGQALVELDPTDAKSELAIIEKTIDELEVKKARLQAQRDGVRELKLPDRISAKKTDEKIAEIISGQLKLLQSTTDSLKGKLDQLKQQEEQMKEQISGIDAQMESKKSQVDLIKEELTGLKKLQAKGLVPKSRILAVERDEARLEGENGELRASKASTQNRIGEVALRALQLQEDLRTEALTELRDAEGKIGEFSERQISLSSKVARTTINAPITGTIYQMAVHTEGGVIGPGETLMLIVPEGDDLVLQAQVSPNDIDQVHTGQQARVRFPSFNSRTTPEIFGEVQQVAADISRADANTPPFYAVRLILTAKELAKLGDNKLKPGMNAEAFIQTTSRSPMSYLLKPLIDQFAHSMREG
jgi:HlyD family secretion protein